ncbi:hypothetical protein HCN44_008814 [Aphidius gifuensis]|uniref:Uncharacterized protein n=1 Tax=Aphidius gifuensis TaxID=684658 RepID=A0A835CPQ6_APHGI|nr:uncharacterized protein LOC122855440 [Aphidius gifuensis]KAF7991502.1 hypothetical protein HCN44_008814 [Aphidius gifuensis]
MLTTDDIESVFGANDDRLSQIELEKKQKFEDDVIPSQCFSSDDESWLISFFKTRKMKHKISTEAFKELKEREEKLLNPEAVDKIDSEHGDNYVAPANLEGSSTNLGDKCRQDSMDFNASSSGCGSCSKHDNSNSENFKYDAVRCRDAIRRTKDLFQQLLDTPCDNDDAILNDFDTDDKLINQRDDTTCDSENLNYDSIRRQRMKRKIYIEILKEKKSRLGKIAVNNLS